MADAEEAVEKVEQIPAAVEQAVEESVGDVEDILESMSEVVGGLSSRLETVEQRLAALSETEAAEAQKTVEGAAGVATAPVAAVVTEPEPPLVVPKRKHPALSLPRWAL